MIKTISAILLTALLAGCASPNQDKTIDDPSFYNSVDRWFRAWELVSKDIYHLDSLKPVDFVFFDEEFVYSTSNITVPQGEPVKGPALLGHQFTWKRVPHSDTLTLPDKSGG